MKIILTLSLLAAAMSSAGESSLTTTYHAFAGQGSSRIIIAPVICHDWNSHSGQQTQINLISVPNVPPTNNPKQAVADLNIASRCKVYFYTSDFGNPQIAPEMMMNITRITVPEEFGYSKEEVVRACLECLRRCLPEKLLTVPLGVKAAERSAPKSN